MPIDISSFRNLKGMNINETVYCIDESVYSLHLSYGNAYKIEEKKDGQVKVKSNRGKGVWIPDYCFSTTPASQITSIVLDDPITDPMCDNVEVTIVLNNGLRIWTTFTTPLWLQKLTQKKAFFTMNHLILVEQLSQESIENAIYTLLKQNQLAPVTKVLY